MTVDRDNMIVDDYLAERAMAEIRREYGLSERRIFQILKARGVKVARKKRSAGDPIKALSGAHEKIGRRLYNFYFDTGMERIEAANKLGVSTQTMRRMELGAHPFDLFDLQDISAFLKVSIGDLVDGN